MNSKKTFLLLAGLASAPVFAQSDESMVQIDAKTENGITYVCGGVGLEESTAMKEAASDYDLMLTFAASNGAYLADVNVDIADARGQSRLQTSCNAPIMLVDFEDAGKYRVRAEANGHTLTRSAQVSNSGRVRTVAMAWPIKTVDMGLAPGAPIMQSSGSSAGAGTGGTGDASSSTGTGSK